MMFWQKFECKKTRRLVMARQDGESPGASIDKHLGDCPDCADYAKESDLLRNALPAWKAPRPGPDFAERALEAFLASRERTSPEAFLPMPRRNPYVLPLSLAAGFLFLIGFTFWFSPRQNLSGSAARGAAFSARSIGRGEMIDSHRDVNLLGMAFPARPALNWNFR